MSDETKPAFEGWAILELMGHRCLGGYVREETIAGAAFLRIDVPSGCTGESDNWCPVCGKCRCPNPEESRDDKDCPLHAPASKHGEPLATQFYSPSSIYCLTPTTEAMARAVAASNKPQAVQRWELPAPKQPVHPEFDDNTGADDEEDETYERGYD